MKKKIFTLCFILLLAAGSFFLIQCKKEALEPANTVPQSAMLSQHNGDPIAGQYIVVFNTDYTLHEKQILDQTTTGYDQRIIKASEHMAAFLSEKSLGRDRMMHVYAATIVGFSAHLSASEADQLKNDPRIAYVEQDKVITLERVTHLETAFSTNAVTEVYPWGVRAVGYADGTGKTAWIIDTGIQFDHPDLIVDQSRSVSYITQGKNTLSPYDQNGHGTHVSGTIAARMNGSGVVGVAYGATLVAVRVLDRNGSGTISGVVKGVDYVGANAGAGDVANMSLGGSASTTLDNAVKNASSKGIFFAVAAGNSSANAGNYSPARANGTYIYTVSAMDSLKSFAYFSNYGNPPIDLCGPGVNVYSTYLGSTYKTLSGTSMATPHIAGLLLLKGSSIGTNGYVNNDPDGHPDPIAHY